MTKYFKVYLESKNGITRKIAKNKAEVMQILEQAKKDGFIAYTVIKRIKPETDVPIGHGNFYEECKETFKKNLETDWRVVGYRVVDYKKFKENQEEER